MSDGAVTTFASRYAIRPTTWAIFWTGRESQAFPKANRVEVHDIRLPFPEFPEDPVGEDVTEADVGIDQSGKRTEEAVVPLLKGVPGIRHCQNPDVVAFAAVFFRQCNDDVCHSAGLVLVSVRREQNLHFDRPHISW